jgi:hypothetical protein
MTMTPEDAAARLLYDDLHGSRPADPTLAHYCRLLQTQLLDDEGWRRATQAALPLLSVPALVVGAMFKGLRTAALTALSLTDLQHLVRALISTDVLARDLVHRLAAASGEPAPAPAVPPPQGTRTAPEVFVSYSVADRDRVISICEILEAAGVALWRDQNEILCGENYGPRIVQAIEASKVLVLMCTSRSLGSANVKQEIQLAWEAKPRKPYLPLLLEPHVKYPDEVRYWLTGAQWIEVLNHPKEVWLPRILEALAQHGVSPSVSGQPD